jgi:dynein heavy chain
MIDEENPITDTDKLEYIFVFCIVWSMGCCLKPESRKKFEEFLRKTSARTLPPSSLFDNFYDIENK